MAEFDPFDVDVDDDLNDEEVIESSTSRKKEVTYKKKARTHAFGDALAGDKKGKGRSVNADGTVHKHSERERNRDGSAQGYEGSNNVATTTGDYLADGIQEIFANPSHEHSKLFEAVRDNDANKGWVAINTENDAWKVMQKMSKHGTLRQYVKGTNSARHEFLETEATHSYNCSNKLFKGVKGEPARITFLPTAQRTARLRVLAKRKSM